MSKLAFAFAFACTGEIVEKWALIPQAIFAQPVRSIILVKLDHVGDFFIALPAFRRIRDAFPDARITLVCGPWNEQLARDVRLFNEVRTLSFFREQTRETFQQTRDLGWTVSMHERFATIAAGSYDLAVDLRYDTDTRRLLTMIDARYRAGIGDFAEFPFLDLAVPSDRYEVRKVPLGVDATRLDVNFNSRGAPVHVEPGRKDLRLEFAIEDPSSPIEIGTSSTDARQLGVGLIRGKITRKSIATGLFPSGHPVWKDEPVTPINDAYGIEETIDFSNQSPGYFTLQDGWSHREPFGVWSVGRASSLRIPIAVGLHRGLRLCLLLRGHTGPAKPRQSFVLSCAGRKSSRATIDRSKSERTLVLPLQDAVLDEACVEIVSEEFFVAQGDCTVLTMVEGFGKPDVSGASSVIFEAVNGFGRVLGRRTMSGILLRAIGANEVSFFQSDPGLGVRVRVQVIGSPFSAGMTCKSVRVMSSPNKYAPTIHQLDWPSLVADTLVRRFAPPADLLGLPRHPLPPALQQELDEHRRAGRRIIVMATGAGKDVTMWPFQYYSALVGMLVGALPCAVYLSGSTREGQDAQRIIAENGSSASIVNICGSTSLMQLSTLLKSADLFIGNSSGTAHLSAMSGVPTLTLQSATNHSHQWGPIGVRAFCMSLDVPCGRCHIIDLSQCSHGFRCMLDLTPEMVLRQALSMLPVQSAQASVSNASVEKEKHVELYN